MGYLRESNIIIAGYGTPGIIGIQTLFGMGLKPNQIGLLTHDKDDRNLSLHQFAVANKVETVQFDSISNELYEWAKAKKPNLLVSLHYRDRIPKEVLNIPDCGCINLHPSLLPEYSGCFSIPWTIIDGQKETGYSYHYMVERFDEGNIIFQKRISISQYDTAFSLFNKLIIEGLKMFENVLSLVVERKEPGVKQNGVGSYYPRKVPFDGKIAPDWDIDRIDRFIRAMYFPPYMGAVVKINGEEYEVKSMKEYLQLKDNL